MYDKRYLNYEVTVKFHKNFVNAGNIFKISWERCLFVKFDIYFLRLS